MALRTAKPWFFFFPRCSSISGLIPSIRYPYFFALNFCTRALTLRGTRECPNYAWRGFCVSSLLYNNNPTFLDARIGPLSSVPFGLGMVQSRADLEDLEELEYAETRHEHMGSNIMYILACSGLRCTCSIKRCYCYVSEGGDINKRPWLHKAIQDSMGRLSCLY